MPSSPSAATTTEQAGEEGAGEARLSKVEDDGPAKAVVV